MNALPKLLAMLTVALYADAAGGADMGGIELNFGGFGTLGFVHSNEDLADFTTRFTKPNGAGFNSAWSSDVDSVIGAQVTANVSDRLVAVVQVTSEQNPDNTYKPSVEWANIKYQATPDFALRVGRIVLPFLLYSESRKVAFTQPWIRLPSEVYAVSPLTRSDGADVSYRLRSGTWTHTVQMLVGRQDLDLVGHGKARIRDIRVIAYSGDSGALATRLVYQQGHVVVDAFGPLFDAFRQFGQPGAAIADRFEAAGDRAAILGAAATYDPGKWFATAEWGRQLTSIAFGGGSGWYVSGGYRFGNLTPYAMYAQARAKKFSDPGLDLSAVPSGSVGIAAALNAAVNAILADKNASERISLGTRWDVFRSVDLKLQLDHIRGQTGSNAGLTNVQAGFRTGRTVDLISASIDVVF